MINVLFSPTLGVFALLQAVALLKYLQTFITKSEFKYLFLAGLGAAGAVFLVVVGLTWGGVVAPWSGRQVGNMLQGGPIGRRLYFVGFDLVV